MLPITKRKAGSGQPTKALSAKTPALSALLDHAARLRMLDDQLRLQLSWPASAPFQLANVRSGMLVLTTELAPVAARLRLEQTRILELSSRAWGSPLGKLLVKTLPAMAGKTPPPPKPPLSSIAAKHLLAASATADPEISAILKRLAATIG